MIDGNSKKEKARKDEEAQAEEDTQEDEAQEIVDFMVDKITRENKLNEVITKYPATKDIFIKHGMPKYVGRCLPRTWNFSAGCTG